MKNSIPPNGKIAKEAKECVQECVSEFISFITSEAAERCQQEKRKTINGEGKCSVKEHSICCIAEIDTGSYVIFRYSLCIINTWVRSICGAPKTVFDKISGEYQRR